MEGEIFVLKKIYFHYVTKSLWFPCLIKPTTNCVACRYFPSLTSATNSILWLANHFPHSPNTQCSLPPYPFLPSLKLTLLWFLLRPEVFLNCSLPYLISLLLLSLTLLFMSPLCVLGFLNDMIYVLSFLYTCSQSWCILSKCSVNFFIMDTHSLAI